MIRYFFVFPNATGVLPCSKLAKLAGLQTVVLKEIHCGKQAFCCALFFRVFGARFSASQAILRIKD
ncbi:MAG: hypothetical protein HUU01_00075 [Saprospiraceae bacterium]|nr:hypothetical protein [Saprospiraceae bacterium]